MSQDKTLRKARARTRRSLAASKFDELRELLVPDPEKAKGMQQTEILDRTLEYIAGHLAEEAGVAEQVLGPVGTLEALVNCMGDMVVVLDGRGTILLPMPCTCALLGVPATLLSGRSFTDLAMWYDKGTVARTLATAPTQAGVSHFRFSCKRASGEPIMLECGLRVMAASNQIFMLVCGSVVVQADSRTVRMALATVKAPGSHPLTASNDRSWILHAIDGNVMQLLTCDGSDRVYGYPLAYVNGRNPYHIAHPDDLPLGLMAHQAVAYNQQAVWLPSRNRGAHQGWFVGYTLLIPCIHRPTGQLRHIISHTYIVHEVGFGDYMPERNEPLRIAHTGALYFEDPQELLELCGLLREKTAGEIASMRHTYDRLEEQLILREHVDLINSGRPMAQIGSSVTPTPPSSSNSCLQSRPDHTLITAITDIGAAITIDHDTFSGSSNGGFGGDRSKSQHASMNSSRTQEVCEMLEQLDDLENLEAVVKLEAERQQREQNLNAASANRNFAASVQSRSSSSPASALDASGGGYSGSITRRLSDEGEIPIVIGQRAQSDDRNSSWDDSRIEAGSTRSEIGNLAEVFHRIVSLHTKEKLSGAF